MAGNDPYAGIAAGRFFRLNAKSWKGKADRQDETVFLCYFVEVTYPQGEGLPGRTVEPRVVCKLG